VCRAQAGRLLARDVKGTDEGERGEDQNFEKKDASFSLARSEVSTGLSLGFTEWPCQFHDSLLTSLPLPYRESVGALDQPVSSWENEQDRL
jgi:Root hair defective 3 GTP-binding protein (RHD3)